MYNKILDLTIPIIFQSFLDDKKAQKLSPKTIIHYKKEIGRFLKYCEIEGVEKIHEIQPSTIRGFLSWLEDNGRTERGLPTAHRALRVFLNFIEFEFDLDDWKNPINKVKPPKAPLQILQPASIEDVLKVLGTCKSSSFRDYRDKAILLTFLETGLRASELLDLSLSDIDIVNRSILVKRTKNNKPRMVFFSKKTRTAITKYLKKRNDDNPLLFISDYGEKLTYEGLRSSIRRRCILVNVPDIKLHSLRRWFVLEMVKSGADIFTIKKLSGHKDMKTMQRYVDEAYLDGKEAHNKANLIESIL